MQTLHYFKPKIGFPEWETKLPVEWMLKNEGKKCYAILEREKGKRSPAQNNALHLGLDMIAKSLNDAGLDMKKVLKPEIDIPWTVESVKEYLFRPVMKAMTSKKSTTELEKNGQEMNLVWDTLMRHLGEKHEIEYIKFPSKESEGTMPAYPPSEQPLI